MLPAAGAIPHGAMIAPMRAAAAPQTVKAVSDTQLVGGRSEVRTGSPDLRNGMRPWAEARQLGGP